jgi:hypothetical protein
MAGNERPHNPAKRSRSPAQSMGWAEYDADLLDNIRKTKKFAVDVSMASDLASKMIMGDQSSPVKSVNNRQATSGAPTADPMCISSVECSPAVTPKVPLWGGDTNHTNGQQHQQSGTPQLPGWATPQRPIALGPAASVSLADRSLTSPSDTQLDGQDLRRVALRRVALLRNAGGSTNTNGTGATVDECGSPMALGNGTTHDYLPTGAASSPAAMSHRRSRFATRPQHQNPLPSPQVNDAMATTPIRYRTRSRGNSDDNSSPDEFDQKLRNTRR